MNNKEKFSLIKGVFKIILIVLAVVLVLNFESVYTFFYDIIESESPSLEEMMEAAGVQGTGSDSDEKNDSTGNDNNEQPYDTVTLKRVVDGDTIIVNYSNDEQETRIRFIGCNTPESVNPNGGNTEEGDEASEYTKSMLSEDMILYLTYDADRTDDYGRTLAYVWIVPPSDNPTEEEVRNYMFNAILIKNGYAEPMCITPNTKYADTFQHIYETK